MRFKLWGTRGSLPSPLRTEEIEAKLYTAFSAAAEAGVDLSNPTAIRAFISGLPHAVRGTVGGDTSCLEVRSAGNLFVFDCGSGLRRLGIELMKEEFGRGKGVAHVFISHTHWDHMMGWPFFGPAYIRGNKFLIYGVHPDLEARFRLQQTAPSMFPQPFDACAADIQFVALQEDETVEIGKTRIRNIRNYHLGESYGYRVEDDDGILVLSTDNEYKTLAPSMTRKYVEFYRNADALIFDAMFSWKEAYLYEDWGHSSAVAGVDLATRAGVRRLFLFHHAPTSTDEQIWELRDFAEAYLAQLPDRPPCEVIVAYDGFEMELWREARLDAHSESFPDGTVVHLSGRLVGETASVAFAAFEEATAHRRDQPLVVNLDNVTLVSHEGLIALFSARRRWRTFALCGLSPELRRTFAKVNALDYFAVYETPDNALSAMEQGSKLRPGRLLGNRYLIEEQIGCGPLGDLFRATDQAGHRQVALFVICPYLGRLPTQSLMKAARPASGLRHPLIMDVFEASQDGQMGFVVMEYRPGRSLRQLLASPNPDSTSQGQLSGQTVNKPTSILPAQAVYIGYQIAEALEYAHSRNVVHGGLRPEYVILLNGGTIKVTNFCLGRIETDKPLSELPAHMGEIGYLAPEQILGHGNSRSSDLYALGAILYEMLTGQAPFPASDGYEDSIDFQLRQPPVPVRRRNASASRSLEYLVHNLLRKSPQRRPPNAFVVRRALTNLLPQFRQSSLAGRDRELEKLRLYLERVAQGQSSFIIVHGQRGTGKSRLVLSAASQRVADQDPIIFHGELFAYEEIRPYKLFAETWRRTLLNLPAHQLSRLLKDLRDLSGPLTALIPGIRASLTSFTPSDVDCAELETAFCETLRLMTDDGPVMLILDNLQWIDTASLHLLSRLVHERIPGVLIVALYRTEEVGRDHPLRRTLNALDAWVDDQLHVLPLGPIEVHQMASSLDADVPSDFGLWLYSETGGNPLHIEQLMQAYMEGPGETRYPPERSPSATLDDAILRRLERLPDGALAVLRQAAVLGHTFPFERLRVAVDLPERQVLAHLDTALQASLIVGHPSENRYSFSHPLIREIVYTEMLEGVRKRYHWRVAYILEQEGVAGLLDEKVDVLAYHFLHAGDHEKAVAYLARGVRRARQLCAYEVAIDYVDQALAIVDQLSRAAATERQREQRRKQHSDLLAARADLEAMLALQVNPPSSPA